MLEGERGCGDRKRWNIRAGGMEVNCLGECRIGGEGYLLSWKGGVGKGMETRGMRWRAACSLRHQPCTYLENYRGRISTAPVLVHPPLPALSLTSPSPCFSFDLGQMPLICWNMRMATVKTKRVSRGYVTDRKLIVIGRRTCSIINTPLRTRTA